MEIEVKFPKKGEVWVVKDDYCLLSVLGDARIHMSARIAKSAPKGSFLLFLEDMRGITHAAQVLFEGQRCYLSSDYFDSVIALP